MSFETLKEWLDAEMGLIATQHTKLGENRLVMQGRHEACQIIAAKLEELTAEAAEPPAEPQE